MVRRWPGHVLVTEAGCAILCLGGRLDPAPSGVASWGPRPGLAPVRPLTLGTCGAERLPEGQLGRGVQGDPGSGVLQAPRTPCLEERSGWGGVWLWGSTRRTRVPGRGPWQGLSQLLTVWDWPGSLRGGLRAPCSVLQRGVPGQEGGAGVGGCGQGACLGVMLQTWVWLEVAGGLLIFWKGQVGVLPSFLPAAQPPPGSQSSVFPFSVFVGNGRLFTG